MRNSRFAVPLLSLLSLALIAMPAYGQRRAADRFPPPPPFHVQLSSAIAAAGPAEQFAPASGSNGVAGVPDHRWTGAVVGGVVLGAGAAGALYGLCSSDNSGGRCAGNALGGFLMGATVGVVVGGLLGSLFPRAAAP